MKRRAATKNSSSRVKPRRRPSLKSASGNEATLSALDALPQQIAIIEAEGKVIATNRAWREFVRAVGTETDRVNLGQNYFARSTRLKAPHLSTFVDGVKAVLAGKQSEFEIEYPCQVGEQERWFHARVTACRVDSAQAVIAHEDISERVRLEREIVAVSAHEQQRLRQELHDGLSQQLTGLKFKASLMEYHLQSKNLPEAGEAKALSELLNEATDEASKLARRMRPVEVEARGLMMALREISLNTEQKHDVKCEVSIARPVFIHDNNTATNLFRIAEEAVSAAIAQGDAKRVQISLAESGNLVTLTVRDNGQPWKDRAADGLGPHLIRYHARMIGGTLEWRNVSPRGVVFSCSFQKHVRARSANPEFSVG
jgi:signal transduction histidine kinase